MKPIDYITDKLDSQLLLIWERHQATKQDHNYLPAYHRHFSDVRTQVTRVLEIGVQTPRSVKLWKDYFPNAEIVGADIDPACKTFEEDRISICIGDQGDPNFLASIPGDFDIIIDDGSHIPEHQAGCFIYLFQHKLRDRGIYVCEDLEGRSKTVEFFMQIVPRIQFWPEGFSTSNWPSLNDLSQYEKDYFVLNTLGMSFYRHIVFVDKGKNPQEGEARHRVRPAAKP